MRRLVEEASVQTEERSHGVGLLRKGFDMRVDDLLVPERHSQRKVGKGRPVEILDADEVDVVPHVEIAEDDVDEAAVLRLLEHVDRGIEHVGPSLESVRAAADAVLPLDRQDLASGLGEEGGCGDATQAATDDDDVVLVVARRRARPAYLHCG